MYNTLVQLIGRYFMQFFIHTIPMASKLSQVSYTALFYPPSQFLRLFQYQVRLDAAEGTFTKHVLEIQKNAQLYIPYI